MSAEMLKPLFATAAPGVCEGELLGRAGAGWRVRLDPPRGVVECALLQTGALPLELAPGDRAVVLVGEAGRAYLIGRLGEPSRRVRVSGQRVVLEAESELVLRTPQASLRLGADGGLEVRAARIVSRASRIQKLLAPLLRLN